MLFVHNHLFFVSILLSTLVSVSDNYKTFYECIDIVLREVILTNTLYKMTYRKLSVIQIL